MHPFLKAVADYLVSSTITSSTRNVVHHIPTIPSQVMAAHHTETMMERIAAAEQRAIAAEQRIITAEQRTIAAEQRAAVVEATAAAEQRAAVAETKADAAEKDAQAAREELATLKEELVRMTRDRYAHKRSLDQWIQGCEQRDTVIRAQQEYIDQLGAHIAVRDAVITAVPNIYRQGWYIVKQSKLLFKSAGASPQDNLYIPHNSQLCLRRCCTRGIKLRLVFGINWYSRGPASSLHTDATR